MAAVSVHPPSAAATALTPPSSDHEDRSWDYDGYQRPEVRSIYPCSGAFRTPALPFLPHLNEINIKSCLFAFRRVAQRLRHAAAPGPLCSG